MEIPIFLSTPKCHLQSQEQFLIAVSDALRAEGFAPRTLGRTDYDVDAPLAAIRRLMFGCCGTLTLAFRKTYIEKGTDRPHSDRGEAATSRDGKWLTSPYCHIEPAMAYQLGLPVLVWREEGVLDEGLLDRGALGLAMPEFNVDDPAKHLSSDAWLQPFRVWVARVRTVHQKRGMPTDFE